MSWITEINLLFHDIIIYWDAPVGEKSRKDKKIWEEDNRQEERKEGEETRQYATKIDKTRDWKNRREKMRR